MCTATGGYASFTPVYYHATPPGFSVRIPAGLDNEKDDRIGRLYATHTGVSKWFPRGNDFPIL